MPFLRQLWVFGALFMPVLVLLDVTALPRRLGEFNKFLETI